MFGWRRFSVYRGGLDIYEDSRDSCDDGCRAGCEDGVEDGWLVAWLRWYVDRSHV
jgi:hypothetical protein